MSEFNDALAAADPTLFDLFGEDATYDGTTPCRVIEDRDTVWLQGEESTSARTEITLSFLLSEVTPERGKLVVVGANNYKLGKQTMNDGSVAQHLVER